MLFFVVGTLIVVLAVVILYKIHLNRETKLSLDKTEVTQLRLLTTRLDHIAHDLSSSAEIIRRAHSGQSKDNLYD